MALVVATGHGQFRWLICAPTMRCPGNVSQSINAYLAMKALLNAAVQHTEPLRVAVSGLCSMTGGMSPALMAHQMRIAYERVVVGLYRYSHWREERDFERFIRGEMRAPPVDLEAGSPR
jgi:hypothetical protein